MKQKQIKRICAMLLAGVMVAGCLAGCGNTETPATGSSDATESTTAGTEAAGTDAAESTEEVVEAEPWVDGPVTIEIFTSRQDSDTNDGTKLYIWRWLEYWLAEQGYDVTIEATVNSSWADAGNQVQLMLGTGAIPDMVWCGLSGEQIVNYGVEEGMLLDWMPYINETDMPNLYALCQEFPDTYSIMCAPDGAMYQLPVFYARDYHGCYATNGDTHHNWVNSTIMKEAGYDELPTTTDDFMNMMRGMVANHTHPEGFWAITFRSYFTTNLLWYGPAGYYTWPGSAYGTAFMIKDGEALLPAYTEDFRELVEGYNMMYNEGLLHPDCLTMDSNIRTAQVANGQYGIYAGYSLTDACGADPKKEDYTQWLYAAPLTHSETGRESILSLVPNIRSGYVWAPSDTPYPRLMAAICDYLYSDEGTFMYNNGPKAGEDPLNLVPGWTVEQKEDGTYGFAAPEGYESFTRYQRLALHGLLAQWDQHDQKIVAAEKGGYDLDVVYREHTDRVTGNTLTFPDYTPDDETDMDATMASWTRKIQMTWADNTTVVQLPSDLFMASEDALTASELKTVINEHISSNAAKFIVGERPLEEVDDFFEELKGMGVEEYIEIYQRAYEPYLSGIFGE